MRVDIRDREALIGVSPGALSGLRPHFRLDQGRKVRRPLRCLRLSRVARDHSSATPEACRLRERRLAADRVFAKAAETNELVLYRDLVTADRDVLRVRAPDSEAAA